MALSDIAFWRTVNLQAAAYGAACLGDRYCILRFEDLCRNPQAEAKRISGVARVPIDSAAAAALVDPPASIERWRSAAAEEIRSLVELGRTALDRFGYEYPDPRKTRATA
jgi:hypothetical protein